ncbi:MAG: hypothetical protein V2A71_10610 [Candidatus Eisenbacteria bacterium]
MCRRRGFIVFIVLVFLVLPSLPCGAIMTRATTEQLTAGAQSVAVADVVSIEPTWVGDGPFIMTYVTLSVREWVKGVGPDEVTVVVRGGEIGDSGYWVEDEPVFRAGEQVVVFLSSGLPRGVGAGESSAPEPQGRNERRVRDERQEGSLEQGDNRAQGELNARAESQPQGGFQVFGRFQGKLTVEKGKVLSEGLPLADFVQKVRRIASTQERAVIQERPSTEGH